MKYSTETKKRKFTETIDLQIGLKNYDPRRTNVSPELSSMITSLLTEVVGEVVDLPDGPLPKVLNIGKT